MHGQLQRQPRTHVEALRTAKSLQRQGWNYSVGLVQINVGNLPRLGLDLEKAFEPCANLQAMQTILLECFERARAREQAQQRALRQSISCHYSGNFVTGFQDGYVLRVVRAAKPSSQTTPTSHLAKESS